MGCWFLLMGARWVPAEERGESPEEIRPHRESMQVPGQRAGRSPVQGSTLGNLDLDLDLDVDQEGKAQRHGDTEIGLLTLRFLGVSVPLWYILFTEPEFQPALDPPRPGFVSRPAP
jgi:hypothetical protein